MVTNLFRQAAENVAGELVSIEIDGTVWADSDGRIIDNADIQKEISRLEKIAEAERDSKTQARKAAVAHAKSLGFTDEMISVMYPTLVEE